MKILIAPHPSLKQRAKPVKVWTPKLAKQLQQMSTLLINSKDPQGIGLAATQVGINKRFFILLDQGEIQVFINPKITKSSTKMLSSKYKNNQKRPLEGCLSVPKLWGFVDRPYQITLNYQIFNLDQTLNTISKKYKGPDAISIQHERDHLDGILFTDHILNQSGTIYKETKTGLTSLKP